MKKYPDSMPELIHIYRRWGQYNGFFPTTTYRFIRRDVEYGGNRPVVYNPYYTYRYNTKEFTVLYALKSFSHKEQDNYQILLYTNKGVFAEETTRGRFNTELDFRTTFFKQVKKPRDYAIIVEDLSMNPGRILITTPDRWEEWYGDEQVIPGTDTNILTRQPIHNKCTTCCKLNNCDQNKNFYKMNSNGYIHPYHYYRIYERDHYNDIEWTDELMLSLLEKKNYVDLPPQCYINPRSIHFWNIGHWI